VVVGVLALIGLVVLFSVIVSRSIADPLRRLTRSATTVADLASTELTRVSDSEDTSEQVPQLAEVDVAPGGEVGELAAAFNRVQSTAAAMLERQSTNRRNVSLMFANVARRTQNLAQRQLTVVDELERNEQDPVLLERLYRLDHLSTRLRRSADKLLVIAGSREQAMITGPIELATALRSALAEIEDYKRVRLGTLCEVTLASPVASDLVLLFAELLENATASSPPNSVIELSAQIQSDGSCLVLIVDHGVGMTGEQLAEENRRLVDRERLDIAPTGVLGLFVVGRLARRHSLGVKLVETSGGGVTASVIIPPELFFSQAPSRSNLLPAKPTGLTTPAIPVISIPLPWSPNDGFVWFDVDTAAAASGPPAQPPVPVPVYASLAAGAPDFVDSAPVSRQHAAVAASGRELQSGPRPPAVAGPAAAPQSNVDETNGARHGLHRRVPGAQLPSTVKVPSPGPAREQPRHDPIAVRSTMAEYQSATVAFAPVVADRGSHTGLTRRIPGASLPGDLPRHPPIAVVDAATEKGRRIRDAEADRRAFDEFAAGLARADESVSFYGPVSDDGQPSDPRKDSTQ
jgi:signal transduction histidine kinase